MQKRISVSQRLANKASSTNERVSATISNFVLDIQKSMQEELLLLIMIPHYDHGYSTVSAHIERLKRMRRKMRVAHEPYRKAAIAPNAPEPPGWLTADFRPVPVP
ncbi:MAG: hypothetical protein ACMG6S_17550, partial [Byssovorax sp.]